MPRKSDDVRDALLKKGYKEKGVKRGHTWFELTGVPPGKQPIRTFYSNGGHGKEISDDNLGKMKKQMKFEDKRKFNDYLDCTYSEAQYRDSLRERGLLSIRSRRRRSQ